jgi:acyl-CoA reductase-like NAD-dependent aldehyde dehydrogenase
VSDYSMTIGGQAAGAGASFAVLNPATGQVTARAPECGRDELDRAMDAGQQAQAGWAADAGARRAALAALADAVEADAAGLARLITQEQGKPLREARAEVGDAIGDLRYFAGLRLEPARVGSGHPAVSVIRRPVGPVAAITPWNFPSHPVPRMVSFTGSIATGKRIAAAAAPDLKRVTLELGGNDPAIVLDDVSVADVAGAVFDNAFSNCGQVCVAVKRVFVPEHLHADFTEALAERARAARVGDGQDADTQVGPLCHQMQFDRVRELVSDAVAAGAKVAAGGRPAGGPGYFFEPTVLSGIGDETRIVAEEQFGPAIPVLPYRDVADAVRRANGTHFGLGASVWTSDPERGAAIAPSIESGTVWVNTHQSAVPGQPFGGLKHSGIGVEGGTWGLEAFTDVQVVHARDRA